MKIVLSAKSRVGSIKHWSFEPDKVYGPVPEPEHTSQPLDSSLLKLTLPKKEFLFQPRVDSNSCHRDHVAILDCNEFRSLPNSTLLVDPESYLSLTLMAANLRKRRGTARGSIARLSGRVTELEATPDQPRTSDRAQQLLTKLQTLESDYRTLNLQIVDLIAEEDTESLDAEQTLIDTLDDDVSDLTSRLEALFAPTRADAPAAPALDRRSLNRRLARVRAGLDRIDVSVTADIDEPEEP